MAVAGIAVRVAREPAADLIPRFDGATLRFTSKASLDAPPGGGFVAGAALMDLGEDGRLVGVTVLEERRFWEKRVIAWPLPGRATPHRLDVIATAADASGTRTGADAPAGPPDTALPAVSEVHWDAGRRLCGVVFADADAPDVVALGPRAYAAVEGERLVGLLADLRGFDRA